MGRSSQTSQSLTRQRRLPGKILSAMSPIGKIVLMVVMMAIVDQSTSAISFARLGAQKDNLISAVGGIKRELLSPVAGIARGIFDAKKSIVQPIIGLKSNLAKAKFGIAKHLWSKGQHCQGRPETRGWDRQVQAAGHQGAAGRQDQQARWILKRKRLQYNVTS